jgi:hypothetical protein
VTYHPVEPFGGPAAWRAADLRASTAWVHQLTDAEVAELDAAVAFAGGQQIPLAALRREDFPLTVLAESVAEWADQIDTGRGFVLVRGLPVDRYTEAQASIAYYGLGLHLGVPVSQNADGDLLGHVRDTGADPNDPTVRLYKTREPQPFHTDGSDVVGLLCLHPARSGGLSSIVSSTAVFDETVRRRPDLVHLWFEPWSFDAYGQQAPGAQPWFDLPLARVVDGRLRVFYLRWYVEKAQRHEGVHPLTEDRVALLDLVDEIAADPAFRLDMDFAPGDIQLLSNHTILHARTGYDDWDDPARRRHLLRLWLTLHRQAPAGTGWGGITPKAT